LESYDELIVQNELEPEVKKVSEEFDKTTNDKNDTLLLNEIYKGTVDILITEDKKFIKKQNC